MSNELKDWQLALLVEARSFDNPALVEANQKEALSRHQGLLDDAQGIDSPVVVDRSVKEKHDEAEALLDARSKIDGDWELISSDDHEAEQEALNDVKELLSDSLKEHHGFKETVVESMSASQMVEQFRDDDEGGIALEALAQQPETGGESADETNAGSSDDEGSEDDDRPPEEIAQDASVEDRNDAKQKLRLSKAMKDRTPNHAEALRNEAADLLGLDSGEDVDNINVEVL